jgi:hypothetical protein
MAPVTALDENAGRLRLAVMRLARRLRQESPPGITPTQLSALSVLSAVGPVTIGELAGLENVQQPTMSRIVDALATGEWVERVADDADRRVTRVVVTPRQTSWPASAERSLPGGPVGAAVGRGATRDRGRCPRWSSC